MKTELALDDVADLPGLQSERSLFKLRHHLSVAKPPEVAALVFATRIRRKLFRERGEIFARARTLQNFFRFCASDFVIKLGMLRNVRRNFDISRLRIWNQSFFSVSRSQHTRLLEHDLQFHATLLVDTRSDSFALTNQHLAQLVTNLFHLLVRNLLASHHLIVCLRVFQKLLEAIFLARLFEECVELSVRNLRRGWLA